MAIYKMNDNPQLGRTTENHFPGFEEVVGSNQLELFPREYVPKQKRRTKRKQGDIDATLMPAPQSIDRRNTCEEWFARIAVLGRHRRYGSDLWPKTFEEGQEMNRDEALRRQSMQNVIMLFSDDQGNALAG